MSYWSPPMTSSSAPLSHLGAQNPSTVCPGQRPGSSLAGLLDAIWGSLHCDVCLWTLATPLASHVVPALRHTHECWPVKPGHGSCGHLQVQMVFEHGNQAESPPELGQPGSDGWAGRALTSQATFSPHQSKPMPPTPGLCSSLWSLGLKGWLLPAASQTLGRLPARFPVLLQGAP